MGGETYMKTTKRWTRKWNLDVPREEVERIVANTPPEVYTKSAMAGSHTPPDCGDLIGQTLCFRGEGLVMVFEMRALNELIFSEAGGEGISCHCQVKTMDHEVYFINTLITGTPGSRQVSLIADTKTGCATICDAHIGTEAYTTEVDREFFFGRLDGDYEGGELHHFTLEMLGKVILWEYDPKIYKIKHMYNSNLYYTYCNYDEKLGLWMATNPANYIKIRDDLYLFSFIEARQTGVQSLLLMDMKTVRDIGSFYGFAGDHLLCAGVGAVGQVSDDLTLLSVY